MRRTAMIEMAFLGLMAGSGAGCVGGAPAVGEQQSAVSGGTQVTNSEFDGVVELGTIGCSGSKIGPRRFLTAGHCLDRNQLTVGQTFRVTKANDGFTGTSTNYKVTVAGVHVHASRQLSTDRSRIYDVALLDVQEATPDIPVIPLTDDYFGDGSPDFRLVAYGCDKVTPAQDYTKQWAQFVIAWRTFWYDHINKGEDFERGAFRHHIIGWTDDSDQACGGDSGAPYLMRRNGRWEQIGVHSMHYDAEQFLLGSRVSNISRWIADPGENDFRDGSVGYLMNAKSGKCADLANDNLSDGAKVAQYPCEGDHTPTQRFELNAVGGGYFQLRDVASGRCLSARSPGFGDKVSQFSCNSADRLQHWKFENGSDVVTDIRNRDKDQCLGIDGASLDDEADLGVWACGGSGPGSNQSWVFTR
jgi:V8-like Glu-specific endopeptidase